mmetsp:Transcript_28946/g.76720  ORF Transcript_28946/g.76720 Transcript_28946/m.76720 type:complete len:91 (-) Transcript_28946:70-342(-)
MAVWLQICSFFIFCVWIVPQLATGCASGAHRRRWVMRAHICACSCALQWGMDANCTMRAPSGAVPAQTTQASSVQWPVRRVPLPVECVDA